jgi:hypothetical protein
MKFLEDVRGWTEPSRSYFEKYRGYEIEGERLGCHWQIYVRPMSADLPILGHHGFTTSAFIWNEATAERI